MEAFRAADDPISTARSCWMAALDRTLHILSQYMSSMFHNAGKGVNYYLPCFKPLIIPNPFPRNVVSITPNLDHTLLLNGSA
jgi:hypothetical protein